MRRRLLWALAAVVIVATVWTVAGGGGDRDGGETELLQFHATLKIVPQTDFVKAFRNLFNKHVEEEEEDSRNKNDDNDSDDGGGDGDTNADDDDGQDGTSNFFSRFHEQLLKMNKNSGGDKNGNRRRPANGDSSIFNKNQSGQGKRKMRSIAEEQEDEKRRGDSEKLKKEIEAEKEEEATIKKRMEEQRRKAKKEADAAEAASEARREKLLKEEDEQHKKIQAQEKKEEEEYRKRAAQREADEKKDEEEREQRKRKRQKEEEQEVKEEDDAEKEKKKEKKKQQSEKKKDSYSSLSKKPVTPFTNWHAPRGGKSTWYHNLPSDSLEFWVRATDLAPTAEDRHFLPPNLPRLANRDQVAVWWDVSGHERHLQQNDQTRQPLFTGASTANGWPTISFRGNAVMKSKSWNIGDDDGDDTMTVALVGRFTQRDQRGCVIGAVGPSGIDTTHNRIFVSMRGIGVNTDKQGDSSPMLFAGETFSDFDVVTIVFDGPNSVIRKNAASLSFDGPLSKLKNLRSEDMISIGASLDPLPHDFLIGDISEVMIYGRRLSADELFEVEGYLSDKYSVSLQDSDWTVPHSDLLKPPLPEVSLSLRLAVGKIPSLAFWVHSDAVDQKDKSKLSVWRDQSPHRRDVFQAEIEHQPVYFSHSSANGWPTVRFSGNQFLAMKSLEKWSLKNTQATFVAVGRFQTKTMGCIIGAAGQSTGSEHYRLMSDSRGVAMNTDKVGSVSPITYVDVDASSYAIVRAVFDGLNSRIFVDEEERQLAIPDVQLLSLRAEDMVALGASLVLATDGLAPKNLFTGDIAEILIFDGHLSNIDEDVLKSYLTAKYPRL